MFDNSTYTKDTHLLKPKNDFVFQCLFSAKNEEITKDFISALLNEKNWKHKNKRYKRFV